MKQGRQPGIYESWADCREQTAGYSGAVFKAFETLDAAQEYLQETPDDLPIKENLPCAYIDGTYSKKNSCYGYGGFIFTGDRYHIIQGTGDNPQYMTERNIAGELLGALAVMHRCHDLGIHELNLYCDYTGTKEYTTGNWKAKTPLAYYYRDTAELLGDLYDLQIHYVTVKGHTGIEGNELADYLAKEAAGVQLRKKDIQALEDFRNRVAQANTGNQ